MFYPTDPMVRALHTGHATGSTVTHALEAIRYADKQANFAFEQLFYARGFQCTQ